MLSASILSELDSTFTVVRDRCTQDELYIICPVPGCQDRSGNCSINKNTGKVYCWRCNTGGKLAVWGKRLGYNFSAALLDERTDTTLEELLDQKPEEAEKLPLVRPVQLPNGFIPLKKEPKSVYAKYIGKMARRKNLDLDTFIEAGVGFTRDDPFWEPYAIFPVFEDRVPVYFQGRLYAEEPGEPTKRFPSRKFVKYGSRYWIYGIDELRRSRCPTVLVVESILNVMSLRRYFSEHGVKGIEPVCVFKHSVSSAQLRKLNACSWVKEMCLLFDADATDQAWTQANRFVNRLRVTIAQMPKDRGRTLDANDDPEAAYTAFINRRPYTRDTATEQYFEHVSRTSVSLAGRRI